MNFDIEQALCEMFEVDMDSKDYDYETLCDAIIEKYDDPSEACVFVMEQVYKMLGVGQSALLKEWHVGLIKGNTFLLKKQADNIPKETDAHFAIDYKDGELLSNFRCNSSFADLLVENREKVAAILQKQIENQTQIVVKQRNKESA